MNMICLKPAEFAFVADRLEIPDAIACGFEGRFTVDEISDACANLKWHFKAGRPVNVDGLSEIQREVLLDSMRCSTVLCSVDDNLACGEITRGEFLTLFRTAASLESKFAAFEVRIPRQ